MFLQGAPLVLPLLSWGWRRKKGAGGNLEGKERVAGCGSSSEESRRGLDGVQGPRGSKKLLLMLRSLCS